MIGNVDNGGGNMFSDPVISGWTNLGRVYIPGDGTRGEWLDLDPTNRRAPGEVHG